MSTNKSFSSETSERYSRALFELSMNLKNLEKPKMKFEISCYEVVCKKKYKHHKNLA